MSNSTTLPEFPLSLAPSAYCVHGTLQSDVCVCDAGWENDLLLLRVNHCNTIAGYGLVTNWLTIAVSIVCQVLSAAWLVHESTREKHWKARTAMWFSQFAALSGIGMAAAHLATGGPTWVFWLFTCSVVTCTYAAVNLVNDIFFDIIKRDLGQRKNFTLRSTRLRHGSLIAGFAVSFLLYFCLFLVTAARGDRPEHINTATGIVFLLQPLSNVCSLPVLYTLKEMLQVLSESDSQSELFKSSRARVIQFRKVFLWTLAISMLADILMGTLTLAADGLWSWTIFPVIMIATPAVGVSAVISTFPMKRASTSSIANAKALAGGGGGSKESKISSKADIALSESVVVAAASPSSAVFQRELSTAQ